MKGKQHVEIAENIKGFYVVPMEWVKAWKVFTNADIR